MKTNDEIKELLYSLKHSYDDKDLQESLTLLEKLINANKQETSNQIFAELDNLHIVENWSTQKGKGIPLSLKQIGAYKAVKKQYGVD